MYRHTINYFAWEYISYSQEKPVTLLQKWLIKEFAQGIQMVLMIYVVILETRRIQAYNLNRIASPPITFAVWFSIAEFTCW